MDNLINKQILFDYFAGNVSALQKRLIDEWSRDPAHQEQFYEWLDAWERSRLQYTADQPAAFERYYAFLYADANATRSAPVPVVPVQPLFQLIRHSWWVWAVAATVTLMAGLLTFSDELLTKSYQTSYAETRTLILPDGSRVTLNANSTLRMSRWFGTPSIASAGPSVRPRFGWFGLGDRTREVRLMGEALFSVAHTADNQRFVVKTDNGPEVVVLGTEFTVFARPRGTKVVLNRGKVVVRYRQADRTQRQVTMKPGQLVTFGAGNGQPRLQHTVQPANHAAWREHRFVFEETTLREVTYLLKENFGLTVEITDPETASLTLSGSYPAQTADELLQIIAEALNVRINRNADKILLSPNSL